MISTSISLPVLELHINGITQHAVSPFYLLLVSIFVRCIYVIGNASSLFFFHFHGVFHCINTPHFIDPCTCSCTFEVFPVFQIYIWSRFYQAQDIKRVALIQGPGTQRYSLLMKNFILSLVGLHFTLNNLVNCLVLPLILPSHLPNIKILLIIAITPWTCMMGQVLVLLCIMCNVSFCSHQGAVRNYHHRFYVEKLKL